MLKRMLWMAVVALLMGTAVASEWTFDGGTCSELADGSGYLLHFPKATLKVSATWVKPTWAFVPATDAKVSAAVDGGRLSLSFEAVAPVGFKTQDDFPLLVMLSGEATGYPDGLIRMGNGIAAFDMKNLWDHGSGLLFPMFRQSVTLAERNTLSFWNSPDIKNWNLRLHTQGKKQPDGSTRYRQKLIFAKSDETLCRPPDMVALKRKQYRRLLTPPQEKGFDPSGWLKACADPAATRETFGRLEDLFDAKSRLYALADRIRHGAPRREEAERAIARAYAALNAMDRPGAETAIADVERFAEGSEAWMPLVKFSPFGWIKCFTQWGYMRAADGCSVFEPTPWNLVWQDGFRCNVAQDARVAVANTAGEPRIFETRFNAPMTDVKFERDWTSTRWLFGDGRRITFSILTPIVDVDGIETLSLSGFPTAPDVLRCVDRAGVVRTIALTDKVKIAPETIPSVLMDFKTPVPAPAAPSKGWRTLDPAKVDRPWLRLSSKTGGWGLILLPGARPVAAVWENGVFKLKLSRRSYVGVLRERDNLHDNEQPEVAEFFAGVAAAYPEFCREETVGRTNGWRYAYRERPNDWGVRPHRIAPVPPLADYAGLTFPGARPFKYPTKWNLFHFVEGDVAQTVLPSSLRREPKNLHGINVSLGESSVAVENLISNGMRRVRLYAGPRWTLSGMCAAYDETLAFYAQKGCRVLIDPHCAEYRIGWQKGLDDSSEGEERFCRMWDELSKIGARHREAVDGYDLYNEPGLTAGSEARWRGLCARAAAIIVRNHPGAKVYYPAIYGGNPNGLFNLTPLGIEGVNEVTTYHFYSPHSFSHQKVSTKNVGGDVCVFYPAWAPVMDWGGGNHWGGSTVDWYDRWTLGALLLPAFEHYASFGVPQHVGEFSVIGYANAKSSQSAFAWTRDVIELIGHNGASWHLWNGGFGLGNRFVKDYIFDIWTRE